MEAMDAMEIVNAAMAAIILLGMVSGAPSLVALSDLAAAAAAGRGAATRPAVQNYKTGVTRVNGSHGSHGLRRRMMLAPTPGERERRHAIWLLVQGWTASSTAEALGRDPHTIGRWAASGMNRVHPHMRGDSPGKTSEIEATWVHPHMRGDSEREVGGSGPVIRFTPTCVGTASSPAHGTQLAAHGSPPHAWGQPALVSPMYDSIRVHPHMRGDSVASPGTGVAAHGSPPHAWGQRKPPADNPHRYRFTPTCVGTALHGVRQVNPNWGSPPHAWGQRGRVNNGSPPHAWGQLTARGEGAG